MSTEPHGVTVFCDDIRQEAGNKLSYMGVYSGDLIVQADQAVMLPKLCAAVHLVIPSTWEFKSISAVLFQDREGQTMELARGDFPGIEKQPGNDAAKFNKISFPLVLSPFPVEGPSLLRMRVYLDTHEVKVGTLQIDVDRTPQGQH